jgi:hypothetical protein
MKIVDCRQNTFSPVQVAVVTWSFLPVAKAPNSRPLLNVKRFEQRALNTLQQSFDPKGERPFDPLQQLVNSRCGCTGHNQQVHMLGHEYKGT